MIALTRRAALVMAAASAPAIAAQPKWRWRHGETSLLVYDPDLAAGRRLAETSEVPRSEALGIEGDRVRFGRALFERRPALVVGVTRPADALLIEEVGREAGYRPATWGSAGLRDLIAASGDNGLVLGWVLAPRS
ncbi:MAG: hypothetical protein B7Z08_01190 [Sphingomonadales bacterium 32-68-7]|nr:MAG: hypothetical protein B7Z08_01190 [Sphingomonadales bacterium 32-68-7]